jgi:hypothetical protein
VWPLPVYVSREKDTLALGDAHILSLQTLGPTDHVKLDLLAFLKRTEAFALDGGVMNEYVVPVRAAEEAETLRVIKPLHSTCFHNILFLVADVSQNSMWNLLRVNLKSGAGK